MLTRSGLAVAVLAGISFAVGRVFGLLELHVIGSGLIAVLFLAWLVVVVRPVDVSVQRTTDPGHPAVGDIGRVLLTLTAGRRTPTLELWEPVGASTGALIRLAPLRGDETVRAGYVLPTQRRGLVQVGPMAADAGDPFGLVHRRRWLTSTHDVIVRPRVIPLTLPTLGVGNGPLSRQLTERAIASATSDEFRSLRAYAPGDDLRRVHWRATARRGDPLVRETDPGASLRIVVVVDLDPTSYGASAADQRDGVIDAFELAIGATAGLAAGAADTGRDLVLLTTDGEVLATEAHRLDETLDRLAVLTPSSPVPTSALRSLASRAMASVVVSIVITGAHGMGRARDLTRIGGPGEVGLVIACGADQHRAGGSFVVTPRDDRDLQRQWTALIGPSGWMS